MSYFQLMTLVLKCPRDQFSYVLATSMTLPGIWSCFFCSTLIISHWLSKVGLISLSEEHSWFCLFWSFEKTFTECEILHNFHFPVAISRYFIHAVLMLYSIFCHTIFTFLQINYFTFSYFYLTLLLVSWFFFMFIYM